MDDRGMGKADSPVESRRPIFLEETRFADSEERIVGLLTVQSIGLKPLFTASNSISRWSGHNSISAWIQIGDHRLASQRGERFAVLFVLRTGNDRACHSGWTRGAIKPCPRIRGNRTGIKSRHWINLSRQAIRQRHVEHVIGGLPRRITGSARVVKQSDVKAAESWLVGGQHV